MKHSMDSEFISKSGYTDLLQVSESTVNGWMRRHWDKGDHYIVIGHTTMINRKRADKWIREFGQQESDQTATDCESESGGGANSSIRKRSGATHTKRVISPARLSIANG